MTSISWVAVGQWLKTTVPGIITLGAIGSVVAVLLLRMASVIGRRMFKSALDRLFFSNYRPFSFAALLSTRYASEGRWADLVIYAMSLFSTLAASLVLFGMCLLSAIIVAIRLGVASPGLLVTLVVFTGVTFILLLRDLMGIAGLWAVRYNHEHNELKKLLSNKEVFYQLTDQIFTNIRTQSRPPQATPPEDPPPQTVPQSGTSPTRRE